MCRIFEEYGDEREVETRNKIVEDLLRQNKLSIEDISAVTKVPPEQVKKLAEKLVVTA